MFDKWRRGLLEKRRAESKEIWNSHFTEEEREQHRIEFEKDEQEREEWYQKWENMEDLKRKQWIKEHAETYLKNLKKINRKYFWRHPFSSIWTEIYLKWFNWFYLIPKKERTLNNDDRFIRRTIGLTMKHLES